MSKRKLAYATGGMAIAAVTALASGVVVERRVVAARREGAAEADRLGSLHSPARPVEADDGVVLHAEVDEPDDGRDLAPGTTLLFVHGFALNLDCWHFQRDALRGRYRMAFYDQRSHGRSERSSKENVNIDQLGDDLAEVLRQLVPEGDVVLVGHSMGGMSILAFAERQPDVFRDRVRGVALIATTAGGLKPHRTISRFIPDGLGQLVAPRLVAALAMAPELVDSARRGGSNIGFLVSQMFAFGHDVPAAEVEFLDEMLAGTPFEVLAAFFPNFSTLDKFTSLEVIRTVPTLIVCGTKDRLTSIGHSRKMAGLLRTARLVESEGSGHMVIFEDRDLVNDTLEQLVKEAVA